MRLCRDRKDGIRSRQLLDQRFRTNKVRCGGDCGSGAVYGTRVGAGTGDDGDGS